MPETTTETSDLITIPANPVALFTDDKQFGEFYQRIKREVETFVPDLSSDKGRKEVASMSFKVTKAKTALDAAGKTLTEDARKQIDKVNAARRTIWDQLDTLAKEVRKPLTEWEEREAKRVERCEGVIRLLRAQAVVSFNETADDVRGRLASVRATPIEEDEFLDFHTIAISLKATALEALEAAVIRLTQEEADRAELERLRAENAAREQREAEARDAAETARLDAEQAEREAEAVRLANVAEARAAEAEAQRIADAAERARLDAIGQAEEKAARERAESEAAAAEEMRRLRAEHDAELAAAERERDAAIAEQQRQEDERKRLDATQAAQAEQQRREDEARTQDRAHRSKLMGEAKDALMASLNLSERSAKQIVLSICAGDIPHISMRF